MSTTEQNWKQDYLDLHEMYTKVVAERDTLAGENDLLLEGKVQDAETIRVLEQALAKCVASLDQLLPYLAKVPVDVGLLNDALMAARPLVESEGPDYPDGCDKDGFPGGCERMGCGGEVPMTQMIEVKTAELEGKALDWAVAMSEGATNLYFDTAACWWFTLNGADRVLSSGWSEKQSYCPSTDWRYGGPLIDREGTFRIIGPKHKGTTDHVARLPKGVNHWFEMCGPTPLIAAMRCLVASKLGDTVQVPKELLS